MKVPAPCFLPWMRFFRIVNLPTVPGDILVGVAAVVWGAARFGRAAVVSVGAPPVAAACVAACALYLFGLADNDIVGAAKDSSERPIPAGEISLHAARTARVICLLVAGLVGAAAKLPPFWWIAAFIVALCCVVYNRIKWSVVMGLCRGLNVVCGAAAISAVGACSLNVLPLCGVAAVWTLYIAAVTKYSAKEAEDPEKRKFIGILIGALVYLQLGALLALFCLAPCQTSRNLLLAGAAMLIGLRLMKRAFPKVSAS